MAFLLIMARIFFVILSAFFKFKGLIYMNAYAFTAFFYGLMALFASFLIKDGYYYAICLFWLFFWGCMTCIGIYLF